MNSRSFPKILVLMVCLASVSLADFSNYLDDLIDCRRVERHANLDRIKMNTKCVFAQQNRVSE